MGFLNIGGRKVRVDDSFLSLSPEQQQATVEEIAAQMGLSPQTEAPAALPETINLKGGPGPSRPTYKPDLLTATGATVNGLVSAVPFLQETTDALMGAGGMVLGKPYDETIRELKGKRDALAEASPVAKFAGTVGGAVGGTLGLAGTKLGAEALGLSGKFGQRVMNSGLSTAGVTGLSSLAEGKRGAEVLGDMAIGGGIGMAVPGLGALVGKAGEGIANAVTKGAQKKVTDAAIKGAPSAEELFAQGSAMFKAVDDAGVTINPSKFNGLVMSLVKDAKARRINQTLDAKSVALYEELVNAAQAGKPLTFGDAHILRQIAQRVATSSEGRDYMFAKKIINALDDFVTQPGVAVMPGNRLGAGNTAAGNELLKGISLWGKAKKTSVIEEAMVRASSAASGLENGLRTEFRRLLRDKSIRSTFTQPEIDAIEKVANGTGVSNITRLLGMFGFDFGSGRNMLGGAIGFGLGGIPAAVAGSLARKGSEVLTKKAAERAARVVGTPSIPIVPQARNMLGDARVPIELLIRGGALSAAN